MFHTPEEWDGDIQRGVAKRWKAKLIVKSRKIVGGEEFVDIGDGVT